MASAGSSRRGWSTTITFKVSSLATLIVLIEPTLGRNAGDAEKQLRSAVSPIDAQ